MAQRIIGLDVGTWSIKAMVLESSIRTATAVELREHHMPRDTSGEVIEGELQASLAATLRDLDHDGIVAAYPSTRVLLRELVLPFTEDKLIKEVLPFRLESVVPKAIDTLVYDYYLLDKAGEEGGGTLMCAAADRDDVAELLAELKEAEADPRILTLTPVTAGNVTPYIGADTDDRSVAFIDLGHTTTTVSIVRDGRVQALRTLSRGGHQLTLALMRGLEVDYGHAEHVKHTGVRFDGHVPEGLSEDDHAHRARVVARALEPLLRELKLTVHALAERTGHPLAEAFIFGGTARLPGIAGLIERVADVPVRAPDTDHALWEALPDAPDARTSGLTATGLALQHVADAGVHQLNLRRGDLAFESDFRAVRERAVLLGVFALIVLALFFGRKIYQIDALESQQTQLVEQLTGFTERAFPDTEFAIDPETPAAAFQTVKRVVENPPSIAAGGIYPATTAFKVFHDVTEIQQNFNADAADAHGGGAGGDGDDGDDGDGDGDGGGGGGDALRGHVELRSVTSDLREATVSGVAFDVVTVEQFRKALAVHACFAEVSQSGGTPDVTRGERQGWKEFTLTIDIACARPSDDVAEAAGVRPPSEE